MSDFVYDPVGDLIRFNERWNDDGQGGPWTLEDRDWVRDEIYLPMHSYNRVPAAGARPEDLCAKCRGALGSWVLDTFDAPLHKPGACPGLTAIPIVNTGVDIPRQSGKTTTGLSIPFARLFLEKYEQMSYVAKAEDQGVELVIQKLSKKIERHPALAGMVHVTDNKIINNENQCELEVLPASHGSITGRTKTLGEYDECRDQKSRVVTASMPQVLARHGYKCPGGIGPDGKRYYSHGRWRAMGSNEEPEHECCPALLVNTKSRKVKCGQRLRRFHGRLLFMSASGVIEGNNSLDWFRNWIDLRLETPDPYTHVFRTEKRVNPSVSRDIHKAIEGSFGDVPGMAEELAVELNNAPARLGEDYVTAKELDGATVPGLRPLEGSKLPALGFIDCSKTTDKTSEVIVVESSALDGAFSTLDLASIQVWDPNDPERCPDGVVDEDLIEPSVHEAFALFPGLVRFGIDTRLMPWAKRLVRKLKAKYGAKIVDTEGWTNTVNSQMYLELHQRIRSKAFRVWPCLTAGAGPKGCLKCVACELRAEFLAMRKRDLGGGGIEVYDQGGDKSGRNRRKGGIHRDVAMSCAGTCKLAADFRLENALGTRKKISEVNRPDSAVAKATRPITAAIAGGGKRRW